MSVTGNWPEIMCAAKIVSRENWTYLVIMRLRFQIFQCTNDEGGRGKRVYVLG